MKKITKRILTICAVFAFTFSAIAQNTSAQFSNNVNVSLEMQAQIQEALSRQTITNSQTSSRAPMAATYVGSFNTNDGPVWTSNPPALSAVEAAALIFGGSPSDYVISTNPNTTDPLTITNTAWATTWGVGGCQEVAEDYFLDLGAPGYNDPGGTSTAISAYVTDNCTSGNTNYVWLASPPPSITCPGNITVSNDPGICGAVVNYTVTATSGSSTIPPLNGFANFTKLGTYNGHTYYQSEIPMNASAVFADALSKGGYVATINDAAENTFINNAILAGGFPYFAYIGLNDVSVEGSYEWQNGDPVAYTNWAPGEPNDSGGEDYVIMYSTGLWNDVQASHNDYYVLEIDATFEQTAGLPSGSVFPVGVTTNTFEVTDSSGNTSSCSFDVTVNDNEAPIFADIYGDGTLANPFTSTLPEIVGSVPTGTYYFSFNGATFQGVLDNDTDGGGWLMILNYVHQAGDNSNLQVRNTDLPLLGASTLGTSEAASPSWGHFGNALAADIDFEEVRFFAQTSRDPNNIIDFTTDFSAVLDYVKTGNGSFSGINNPANYNLGVSHNASIPQNAPDFFGNQGDLALTNFPFWRSGQAHWGIRGLGNRWEVDDFTYNSFSTIHRVWVRGDLSPSPDPVSTTITVQLDGSGNVTISPADFGLTPTDNCSPVTQTLSITAFDCSNIGSNTIQLTATDAVGNAKTIDVIVIVEDTVAPVALCQNITVQLDGNGDATITPADVDGGSTDNCGIASLQFTDQITAFAEVGEGQTLTITLPVGRVVTSVDFASYGTPNGSNGAYTIGSCHASNSQTIVEGYALGNNSFSIPATNAVFGDPCGGTVKRLYVTVSSSLESASLSFDCSDIGNNSVTLFVTDVNGNTATCTATVTVEDTEAPVITCVPDATKNTDPGVCQYTVVGTEFDATFTDNCTSGTITNDFNASATLAAAVLPKGITTVVWTVNDGHGQTATCTTVITVEDNEAPGITCVPNATRDTDPGVCEYTIVGAELDAIFTDNCADGNITNDFNGTDTLAGEILPTGNTTVVWTVNDGNGQTATCTTIITVEDNEAPIIVCPADISANTDAGDCFALVSFAMPYTQDNCGVDTVVQTVGLPSGSQFPVGVNIVEFTVTDVNGNVSTCSFTITVTDNEAPVAVCQNITIQLDANGNASITAADVDGGSTDQCGVASISIDMDTFDCSNVGDNNVTLTVTDVNGNTSTCIAIVTVEDVTAPVVACQNITVELDPITGTVTIAGTDIDNGSTDACGIASYDLDIDTFDCSNIGDNTVVLTVTDVNGNTETCTAIVTVEDNTSPVLVCQDFTLELGADGTATLDPSDVIASNDDACGIFTVAVDITQFSCADIGTPVTVQVFTQDNNGNLATCMATVTVVDNLAPVVTCPADQTVDPGVGNLFYIVPDYFATGEATAVDNCTDPVTLITQSPAVGTPLPDGIYTITLTATDEYGNTGICEFELIVESVLGTGNNSQNLGSIAMYPNPAKSEVTIGNPQSLELESANIYDLTGRLVQSFNLKGMATTKTLNVDNLAAATYVVIIQGKQGQITNRLLKE